MKIFKWHLQKVLDITEKKEKELKNELSILVNKIQTSQSMIDLENKNLNGVLASMDGEDASSRAGELDIFMRNAKVTELRIGTLTKEIVALEQAKETKMETFLKTKSSREMLEHLRKKALVQYKYELQVEEQKHLDMVGGISLAKRKKEILSDQNNKGI